MKRNYRRRWTAAFDSYLPDDIGPIVPSQWVDINRPWRPSDSPEGQLMLAIFMQALIDFREGTMLERRSAKNWFLRRGEGFDATCELMHVDAGRVRNAVLERQSNEFFASQDQVRLPIIAEVIS
jgi:hypothetical protein